MVMSREMCVSVLLYVYIVVYLRTVSPEFPQGDATLSNATEDLCKMDDSSSDRGQSWDYSIIELFLYVCKGTGMTAYTECGGSSRVRGSCFPADALF